MTFLYGSGSVFHGCMLTKIKFWKEFSASTLKVGTVHIHHYSKIKRPKNIWRHTLSVCYFFSEPDTWEIPQLGRQLRGVQSQESQRSSQEKKIGFIICIWEVFWFPLLRPSLSPSHNSFIYLAILSLLYVYERFIVLLPPPPPKKWSNNDWYF